MYLALAVAITGPSAYAQRVTVSPLGILDPRPSAFSQSSGSGVNSSGQVTGVSDDAQNRTQAFLTGAAGDGTRGIGYLYLNPLGASVSTGRAVNASGQVAGFSRDAQGLTQAFITGPNGADMRGLGFLDPRPAAFRESFGFGINVSGQVTGMGYDVQGRRQAFLTGADGSGMTGLGFLNPDPTGLFGSFGYGVNASGQVTGESYDRQGRLQGFLTGANGRGMTGLGYLNTGPTGPFSSAGRGVNDVGQVTGYSYDARGLQQAFRTAANGTGMTGLGFGGAVAIPGCLARGIGNGINAAGAVVGSVYGFFASSNQCVSRAFLFTESGGMEFLDDLLAADGAAGWSITDARAVSDNGYIAAQGFNPSVAGGRQQALLLRVPQTAAVPEPRAWAMVSTGLLAIGGLAACRRWRAV